MDLPEQGGNEVGSGSQSQAAFMEGNQPFQSCQVHSPQKPLLRIDGCNRRQVDNHLSGCPVFYSEKAISQTGHKQQVYSLQNRPAAVGIDISEAMAGLVPT